MTSASLPGAESTYDAIRRIAEAGLPAQGFLEEIAWRVDRVVPSDGFFLAATDPETTLCMGAGVAHDLPEELCRPTWDYEFHVPDFLKFADLVASGRAIGDLHEATGGRPERSPRWRVTAEAAGFRSELRAAFTIDGAAWGLGQFHRMGDAPRYSTSEKAWLERIAQPVAAGLRRALISHAGGAPAGRGPGVVVLDGDGRVVSATDEAVAWFEEVQSAFGVMGAPGAGLPFEAFAYAMHARAAQLDGTAGGRAARPARLRTRAGVWLVLHASALQGTDHLALVVEPAKAADVAPLIVEAYRLTQRELDVTRAIARGQGTAEIAGRLHLSPHTVRDHIKSVFEKVGVSSRGELVAKVFAEHYAEPLHDAIAAAKAR